LNKKPKVLVGVAIHEEALKRLKDVADVDVMDESAIQTKDRLLKIIEDYEGAIVALPPFDREVIAHAKKLKVISRHGVGYDNVDVKAAKERGICVTITPALSETVADMAFTLLLSTARRIPQAHIYIKNGLWRKRAERSAFMGVDVFGKTLGLIGLGRIGSIVAKRGRGFDMNVLYYDIIRNRKLEEEQVVEYRPFSQLLAEADFISIHTPLTEETRGLISEKEFKTMKKSAIIVNTSRGPVIDERALYRALKEGWIAAAGLDVFEEEPTSPDNPLLTLDNVVLTPHIAGSTWECRRRCAMMAVENTMRVLRGEKPLYSVT
jgi:glyoxylate reductase